MQHLCGTSPSTFYRLPRVFSRRYHFLLRTSYYILRTAYYVATLLTSPSSACRMFSRLSLSARGVRGGPTMNDGRMLACPVATK